MALNNHVEKFTLDMAPGEIAPVLNVSQGDTGRAYIADMYWGGASYDVSGLTVRLRGRKRDNTVFDYALPAPSGSTVNFDLKDKEQITIVPGNVDSELVFTDSNSRVVGTAHFLFIVEEAPFDPDAPSQSVIPSIVDLIEQTVGGDISDEVDAWFDAHPEATTTVQDGAVTTQKLANGAVTTNKIADDAITYAELAPNAVETSIIKNGAVTSAKVDADFLKTIENAYVTPEMFGAVGDGVTDDTAAINSCISNANGKIVLFSPKLVYGIKSPIVVKSNRIIDIEGTIKALDGYDCSIEFFDRVTETPAYTGVRDVVIFGNGTFDAQGDVLTDAMSTPIRIYHCNNILIKNIKIKNYSKCHAIEIGGSKNVTVDGVIFCGCFANGAAHSHEAIQLEQTSSSGAVGGLPYDDTFPKNITIKNCTFEASEEGGKVYVCMGVHSKVDDATKTSMYENIIFENNKGSGFEVNSAAGGSVLSGSLYAMVDFSGGNFRNVIIRNNIADAPSGFFSIGQYSEKITVENNIVKNSYCSAIGVSGTDITEVNITGNIIDGFALYNPDNSVTNACVGIYVNVGANPNVKITENIIKSTSTYCTLPIHTTGLPFAENSNLYTVTNNVIDVLGVVTASTDVTTANNFNRYNKDNAVKLFENSGGQWVGTITLSDKEIRYFRWLEITFMTPWGSHTEIIGHHAFTKSMDLITTVNHISRMSGYSQACLQMMYNITSDFKQLSINYNSRLDIADDGTTKTFRVATNGNTNFLRIISIYGYTGSNAIM